MVLVCVAALVYGIGSQAEAAPVISAESAVPSAAADIAAELEMSWGRGRGHGGWGRGHGGWGHGHGGWGHGHGGRGHGHGGWGRGHGGCGHGHGGWGHRW